MSENEERQYQVWHDREVWEVAERVTLANDSAEDYSFQRFTAKTPNTARCIGWTTATGTRCRRTETLKKEAIVNVE